MWNIESPSCSSDWSCSGRSERRLILFVIYEGVNILDLAGPMQVFATASEQSEQFGPGKAYILAVSSAPDTVHSSAGLGVETSQLDDRLE